MNPKNPVGSTRPALPPSQADGNKANPKGPSPAYTTVTLSNGVTTSAIFSGKGLTVTSTSPGTITVSNGTNTVTMPGGSMNLSGAASVRRVQAYKPPAMPPAVIVASPIVGVGAAGVTVGAALVGVATGHPIQVSQGDGRQRH